MNQGSDVACLRVSKLVMYIPYYGTSDMKTGHGIIMRDMKESDAACAQNKDDIKQAKTA